jgi:Leucine-rich repeat (LRR) protein
MGKGRGGYGSSDEIKVPTFNLGDKLKRFKNLKILHIEGLLNELPDEIGELRNLEFISVPNNPNLTKISEKIAQLPNLQVLNLRNSPKAQLPPAVQEKVDSGELVVVSN